MMRLDVLKEMPATLLVLPYMHDGVSLLLACTEDGAVVRSAFINNSRTAETALAEWQRKYKRTAFTPAPKSFTPDISRGKLVGTPFQIKVWQNLNELKLGDITHYQALAAAAGNITAYRAAGTAVGANPLAPFIPCHRVLAKDGGIGGFSGGLPLKRQLLAAEGISVAA